MYVLLYYVIGYRKKVVLENLRNSFPEKNEDEIKLIRKKFYKYLCDLFLETFKTLTISKEEAIKRCKFNADSLALFEKLYAEKKSIILVMGHYGNWEWGGSSFTLENKHQLYVIYKPLANKYFDRLIYKMRTRFGTKLTEMNNTWKDMLGYKNIIIATAFIADQTPSPDNAYWTTFLNQDTPVFLGAEKIAKKLNYPIVFINIKRMKRGFYEMSAELLFEDPRSTKDGEISEAHTRQLEQEVIKQPEIWLWSHRRWKHKKN